MGEAASRPYTSRLELNCSRIFILLQFGKVAIQCGNIEVLLDDNSY